LWLLDLEGMLGDVGAFREEGVSDLVHLPVDCLLDVLDVSDLGSDPLVGLLAVSCE